MLYQFLKTLHDTGQPEIEISVAKKMPAILAAVAVEEIETISLVKQRFLWRVQDFPGDSPALDLEAAMWGAKALFLLCAVTAFRELEMIEVEQSFLWELPNEVTAEAHLSADLFLHYLPDLQQLVQHIADGDPLLELLDKVALRVPLSSVGMTLSEMPDLNVIYQHAGLDQYHAERVVALSDNNRYNIPEVEAMIEKLSGNYPSLVSENLIKKTT